MIKELNDKNFSEETKTGLKLVEFYTGWCGYCKKQQPELEKMDKVWIGQIDADNSPQTVYMYNVNAFPTFLIFKNGKEVERFSGFKTKEDLMGRMLNHIK